MQRNYKKYILLATAFLALFFAVTAGAENTNNIETFNVDKNFDASGRSQLMAILVKNTKNIYFYVEKSWWDIQPQDKRNEALASLDVLNNEFDSKIYPTLTSVFGPEWKPGVDGDGKLTVLFQSINSSEGGYFREADEYIKLQLPNSNEREMVYLSLDHIADSQLKRVLAHELVHLITFNQKNRILEIEDDVWLNEARADYSSTILGYDSKYEGSNLQQRVGDFIQNPSDSITEWQGTKYDYASVSLFTHYLVDQYGINALVDSLKSKYSGIESINYALVKNGYKEDFEQIFSDWSVASVLNDCSVNKRYCYLSENLAKFKLAPSLNFLPLTGNVSLSVTNVTKSWTGNWLKFIGGNGNLKLDFSSLKGLDFKIPYIVGDSAGSYSVKFLALDQNQKGEINIESFGTDYKSLIVMPFLSSKNYNPNGLEPTYPFTYTVSITGDTDVGGQDLIQQLLDRIDALKKEIARLQGGGSSSSCYSLNTSLSFGMSGNDVKCLQEFLKSQGGDIYPGGFVTGYFGSLTRVAVIKFQEKYKDDILTPLGLSRGTGYVGLSTRNKINQILGG